MLNLKPHWSLLFCLVVFLGDLGLLWRVADLSRQTLAVQAATVESALAEPKACDCDQTFAVPTPIVWRGRVTALFLSGQDFGLTLTDQTGKYRRAYIDGSVGDTKVDLGAMIQVTGQLVGETCAYAQTAMGGCSAEVRLLNWQF